MKPELSIIIVNWNGMNFLPGCLESIASHPPNVPFEVIVIDNASSDKSPEWLASGAVKNILPEGCFKFIQNEENLGFGRANNLAIEQTETPFVFLLNPDTIVKPGAIHKLLETLQSDQSAKMVVPKVVGPDGRLQGNVCSIPSAAKIFVEGLYINRVIFKKKLGEWLLGAHWSYDKRKYVPLASGCAMLVDRAVIKAVGAFNPGIFMFGEDLEWCYRINQSGWKIIFEPDAELIHIGGQSSLQKWTLVDLRVREERAVLKAQEAFLSPFQIMRIAAVQIVFLSSRSVLRFLRRKDNEFLSRAIALRSDVFGRALKRMLSRTG